MIIAALVVIIVLILIRYNGAFRLEFANHLIDFYRGMDKLRYEGGMEEECLCCTARLFLE